MGLIFSRGKLDMIRGICCHVSIVASKVGKLGLVEQNPISVASNRSFMDLVPVVMFPLVTRFILG